MKTDYRSEDGFCMAGRSALVLDCDYFIFKVIGACCAKCKHESQGRCLRPHPENEESK